MDLKPLKFDVYSSRTRFIILCILLSVLVASLIGFSVFASEESDEFEEFSYIDGTSPEGIVNETDALSSHAETLRSSSYRIINSVEDIEYLYNRSSGTGLFNSGNTSVFEDYISNTTVLATNLSSTEPEYDSQELTNGTAPYTGARDIIRFIEFTTYNPDRIVQDGDGKELVYSVNGVAEELENQTQSVKGEIRLDDDGYFSSINATVQPRNASRSQIQISINSVGSTTVTPPDWLSDANKSLSSRPEVSSLTIPEVVNVGEESVFQILATTTDKEPLELEYTWSFGNNNTETGIEVSNTYENAGNYEVQVVIQNPENNQSTTVTRNISVIQGE